MLIIHEYLVLNTTVNVHYFTFDKFSWRIMLPKVALIVDILQTKWMLIIIIVTGLYMICDLELNKYNSGVAHASYDKNTHLEHLFTVRSEQSNKIVLFWNKLYSSNDYNFGLGHSPFMKWNCSVPMCTTTTDRSLFEEAHAVVFHLFGNQISHKRYKLPARAHPGQIYVMAIFESPLRLFYNVSRYKNHFNLTYTYMDHPDTDIIGRHGENCSAKEWGYVHNANCRNVKV